MSGSTTKTVKTAVFCVVMLLTTVLLWRIVQTGNRDADGSRLTFSEFRQAVIEDRVARVRLDDRLSVEGELKDGGRFTAATPPYYPAIVDLMIEHGVSIDVRAGRTTPAWLSILINASPFILLLAFWLFMVRQVRQMQERQKENR